MTEQTVSIQDRVNEICNCMYSKGIKPSVRLVLAELPDVRSTSTVHKYFANWKNELEANQQSLYDLLGFSSEFTQSFMREITRFSVEAEQRYKEQAQDANEQRDHAVADLAQSEEKLCKQNAVVFQQEKTIKELQTELAKEREAHDATVNEIRQQLSHVLEENKILHSTVVELNKSIASYESAIAGNEKLIQSLNSHQESMTKRNAELVAENKSLNSTVVELKDKLITQIERENEKLELANKTLAKKD